VSGACEKPAFEKTEMKNVIAKRVCFIKESIS
jgi:hypothetical protein